MPRLLVIDASPQGSSSVSRSLTARFVAAWCHAFQGGEVTKRDLATDILPYISADWILGAFTPADMHSPASAAAMRISDELIAELHQTDHILVGTPMHNLMISASLKAYIDHVVRVGSTVTANNEGLVTNKQAAAIIASGGDFSPGSPAERFNHAAPYLRAVLSFIGITELQIVLAGPTRRVATGEETLETFTARFESSISNIIASWISADIQLDRKA